MLPRTPIRKQRPDEEGYILIGVMLLLVLFVIAMAVAAPRIAKSIQRDREVETMHRGKQYVRAIQLYYRKFGAYPPNIDALVKSNEIRFLRKRYIDPMTGKDDWKPIMFGQNKTPMAMGFFGQPLGGTGGAVLAGTGPSGGNGITGASTFGSSSGGGGSSLYSNSVSSNPTSASGQPSTFGSSTGIGSSASTGSGTDASGSTPTDANGTPIGGSSPTGQTFGGGGIIGFAPPNPKLSILVFKKKNHYNEWEFLYSPLQDQQMISGGNAGGIGQPASGIGNGTNSTGFGTGGFGSGSSGTGSGSTGGGSFGPNQNGGSTPIAPPGIQPQQ